MTNPIRNVGRGSNIPTDVILLNYQANAMETEEFRVSEIEHHIKKDIQRGIRYFMSRGRRDAPLDKEVKSSGIMIGEKSTMVAFINSFSIILAAYYKYVILGLEELDATQSLALLQRAKLVLFENENMPEYVGKRREVILQHKSDDCLQLLNELDKQFYKDPMMV